MTPDELAGRLAEHELRLKQLERYNRYLTMALSVIGLVAGLTGLLPAVHALFTGIGGS